MSMYRQNDQRKRYNRSASKSQARMSDDYKADYDQEQERRTKDRALY